MTLYEMLEKMRGRIGLLLAAVFIFYVSALTLFVSYHRVQLDEWVEIRRADQRPVDSIR